MKTLLQIDSSPRAERSHSRQLTRRFVEAWHQVHPNGRVTHRDLGATPVPLVTEDWIAAAFSDPSQRTPEQRAVIAISDKLVDELIAADELVIGAPMYNFGVTASLKAWIDQVVRVGRTVEYPSYTGLLRNKKVTIITTRGGAGLSPGEPMAQHDALVPYLKQILGFIGLTNVSVIYAGNLAGPDEARRHSLDQAGTAVEALASR